MRLRSISYSVGRVVRQPRRLLRLHHSKVLSHLHQIIEGEEFAILRDLFGIGRSRFDRLQHDLLDDAAFRQAIESRSREIRHREVSLFGDHTHADLVPPGRILYYCVRLCRPDTAIDTGVLDGHTSAFILKGLEDNGHGHLWSIDLPAYEEVADSTDRMNLGTLPPGQEPGWVIPEWLRPRWTLQKGTSQELLPPLLERLGRVGFFFHDSLHTSDHMLWEYWTVWPYLADGALLLSDDIFWNTAFWTFTREVGSDRYIKCGVGMTRKEPS